MVRNIGENAESKLVLGSQIHLLNICKFVQCIITYYLRRICTVYYYILSKENLYSVLLHTVLSKENFRVSVIIREGNKR